MVEGIGFKLSGKLCLGIALGLLLTYCAFGNENSDTGFSEPTGQQVKSEDGTVSLAWNSQEADRVYEVRRWEAKGDAEGVLVYEGSDTASYLSGLPEGVFTIKIRSRSSEGRFTEWPQDGLEVTVAYIDLGLVKLLMGAGLVTFIAIVGTIVAGHRRHSVAAAS